MPIILRLLACGLFAMLRVTFFLALILRMIYIVWKYAKFKKLEATDRTVLIDAARSIGVLWTIDYFSGTRRRFATTRAL